MVGYCSFGCGRHGGEEKVGKEDWKVRNRRYEQGGGNEGVRKYFIMIIGSFNIEGVGARML